MFNRRHIFGLLTASPLLAHPAMALPSAVFSKHGLAIRGYDPVSYFMQDRAMAGSAEHQLLWHGAMWQFSNRTNMTAFEMNPAAYAPQYGGYCAYALSGGDLQESDPLNWSIQNDRLYLNQTAQTQLIWLSDVDAYVARADQNWAGSGLS